MKVHFSSLAVVALAGVATTSAHALSFSGSSGSLEASVDFSIVAGKLQVVLSNTSTADVMAPADVLTAVFFKGANGLTPVSALLTSGSSVFYDADGQPSGGNVGGEWAYKDGLSYQGATAGISSTGLSLNGSGGLFGQPNFNGTNLQDPAALDGVQYGILSAGDDTATGNTGVKGSGGLIKSSVTFLLSGLPQNFQLSNISGVVFQYGTDQIEPKFAATAVPEPSTYLAGCLLALPVLAQMRRMRRSA